MKATAEKLEKNRVALQIEVDAVRVDQALERAYRKVAKKVNVPGFRKGRVPRKIVEARLGKEVLYDEVLEELVPEAYREALEATETDPIDQPQVSDVEIEEGTPLRFRAEVDVKPEAELGEYKGLKVEKLVEQVDGTDIDHVLEHLREENSELLSADRDMVREGDFVVIDFEGFVDGEPFQGGAGKGYTLEIGSGRFIAGFEEQLVGTRLGQEVEVAVTFPDDYQNEQIKGKEATFKVTIQAVKIKRLPSLDDEFARDVSEAETLLQLRSQIREEMEESARRRADQQMREKLLERVRDGSAVEVPEVMVDRELSQTISEFARSLAYRGINPETYLERSGKGVEDLRDDFRPEAEGRVKTNLVLEAVARIEGISVSREELEAKIDELVEESRDSDAAREQLADPDRRAALKESLTLEKVVDFLVEQAEIEEKVVPSQGHGHDHDSEGEDGETRGSVGGDEPEAAETPDAEDEDGNVVDAEES